MSRKLLIGLVAAVCALVIVPGASPSSHVRGVVVKVDAGASTVALARGNGRVVLVHTGPASTAALGQLVDVRHGQLSVVGRSTTTRLRGVVSATSTGAIQLSAGGVQLAVDRGTVARTLPVGARVDLVVVIDDGLTIDRVREVEVEDEDEHEDEVEHEDDHHAATVPQQGGQDDDHRGDDHHGGRGDGGGDHGGGGDHD